MNDIFYPQIFSDFRSLNFLVVACICGFLFFGAELITTTLAVIFQINARLGGFAWSPTKIVCLRFQEM
jgi:hypothetical protein